MRGDGLSKIDELPQVDDTITTANDLTKVNMDQSIGPEPNIYSDNEHVDNSNRQEKIAFPLISELKISDRITSLLAFSSLIVAIGSLAVAYLTYKTASDTRDIKQAVRGLADLASQTKRQADAVSRQVNAMGNQENIMAGEFGEMQTQTADLSAQAVAAQGQLSAAKAQTSAISQQTTAIKDSSNAAVRTAGAQIESAQAQTRAAQIAAAAQQPTITLADVTVRGLNNSPDKSGVVHFTMNLHFMNIGGSSVEVRKNEMHIFVGEKLPPTPPQGTFLPMAGNGIIIGRDRWYGPTQPYELSTSKAFADSINAGKANFYFYGRLYYLEATKVEHTFCYSQIVMFKDGDSLTTAPEGSAAYQCSG